MSAPAAVEEIPPAAFADGLGAPSPLRRRITAACRGAEPEAVARLLEEARLSPSSTRAADTLARQLARQLRARKNASGVVNAIEDRRQLLRMPAPAAGASIFAWTPDSPPSSFPMARR